MGIEKFNNPIAIFTRKGVWKYSYKIFYGTFHFFLADAGLKLIQSKGFEPLSQLLYTEAATPDEIRSIPTLNFI